MLQLNNFIKQSMLFVLMVAFHREITLVNNAFSWTRSSGLLALFTLACAVRPANVNKPSKPGLRPAKRRRGRVVGPGGGWGYSDAAIRRTASEMISFDVARLTRTNWVADGA